MQGPGVAAYLSGRRQSSGASRLRDCAGRGQSNVRWQPARRAIVVRITCVRGRGIATAASVVPAAQEAPRPDLPNAAPSAAASSGAAAEQGEYKYGRTSSGSRCAGDRPHRQRAAQRHSGNQEHGQPAVRRGPALGDALRQPLSQRAVGRGGGALQVLVQPVLHRLPLARHEPRRAAEQAVPLPARPGDGALLRHFAGRHRLGQARARPGRLPGQHGEQPAAARPARRRRAQGCARTGSLAALQDVRLARRAGAGGGVLGGRHPMGPVPALPDRQPVPGGQHPLPCAVGGGARRVRRFHAAARSALRRRRRGRQHPRRLAAAPGGPHREPRLPALEPGRRRAGGN